MRPGVKTSEFYMALAVLVGGVWLFSHGHANMGEHMILAAMLSYGISRGAAKLGDGIGKRNGTPPSA